MTPGPEGRRPWRVLQLASTSDMGGTERMILFLVEHMDREQFTPYVGCLLGSGELIKRAAPHCSGVEHFGFKSFFSASGFIRLVDFIRTNQIDLVQCYGLRADTVGRLAAKVAGARVVVSSIRSIDPWRGRHHSMLDRLTAPLVNIFIANSDAGKQATVQREGFASARIRVIYGGIPAREIPRDRRDQIRRELGLSDHNNPVVGILANIRDMKGHRDVVHALPQILARRPNAVFLFAGRDDSNGEVKELAEELKVDHAIRFLGYVHETERLLAAMDIFMLPSHWEGLPASVLEAMHAGLPIITTPVGGIPELVRDNLEAVLVSPGKPDELAQAVVALAEDWPRRARLAKAAEKRAQTEFSLEQMVRRTEEVYLELLQKR